MSPIRRYRIGVLSVFFVIFAALVAVPVGADEIDAVKQEAREISELAKSLGTRFLGADGFKSRHYAEERLIDGENFYRLKDYQRAAIIFMDIIESYSGHAAYPDALFYFADSLFLSRDFYGARQWFNRLLDESGRPGMGRFRKKAIERLIEIGIHVNDFEGVEKYFDQLGQAPDAETRYIKGKYLYFRKDYEGAKQEFSRIAGNAELELKAAYFTGVILTRQTRYDDAIEIFKSGAKRKAANAAEQEIIDLMNLGQGRLYYEKDFVENASVVYQLIGRYSPYYDTALYEAASVQIRAGNMIQAERILEVLTLAMPDSRYIPKAKLLRGNLLLRSGRYDDAERIFEETIGQFTPVRDKLDDLITEQADTSAFFSDLMEQSLTTLDVTGTLPPLIVKWVGEEPEVQRALALASDLGVTREYTRETERLVRLLEAVIDGPSRINAIPTLRSAKRRGQQLNNRLGQLRVKLSKISQKKMGGSNPKFLAISQERTALVAELSKLPTSDEQYKRREDKARAVYQRMRKELTRNVIRLDKLVAMIVALERLGQDPIYIGGVSEESLKALEDELKRHRAGVEEMRQKASDLREDVERARYQVGVGDVLDKKDQEIRAKMKDLNARERELLRSMGGQTGARIDMAYAAVEATEKVLEKLHHSIDREAERQIEELSTLVRTERARVTRYRAELLVLNREAEEVVGGVTFQNFSNVRKRFHDLILKADVGIIDVAWMRKEEHKARGASLTKDRLKEVRHLDEEFNEVIGEEKDSTGGE